MCVKILTIFLTPRSWARNKAHGRHSVRHRQRCEASQISITVETLNCDVWNVAGGA